MSRTQLWTTVGGPIVIWQMFVIWKRSMVWNIKSLPIIAPTYTLVPLLVDQNKTFFWYCLFTQSKSGGFVFNSVDINHEGYTKKTVRLIRLKLSSFKKGIYLKWSHNLAYHILWVSIMNMLQCNILVSSVHKPVLST